MLNVIWNWCLNLVRKPHEKLVSETEFKVLLKDAMTHFFPFLRVHAKIKGVWVIGRAVGRLEDRVAIMLDDRRLHWVRYDCVKMLKLDRDEIIREMTQWIKKGYFHMVYRRLNRWKRMGSTRIAAYCPGEEPFINKLQFIRINPNQLWLIVDSRDGGNNDKVWLYHETTLRPML